MSDCSTRVWAVFRPDNRKYISAMRMWDVEKVRITCPDCFHEDEIAPGDFDTDELWYQSEFEWECGGCGKKFWTVIDDDNR